MVDYQPGQPKEHDARRRRLAKDTQDLSRSNYQLVQRLIDGLLVLEEASTPVRGGSLADIGPLRRIGSSEVDEGASTRQWRALLVRFQKTIAQLLDEFDARVDGSYQAPSKPERVRCVYARCQAYGKRIPKFVGPRLEIELVRCPKCDKKLSAA